MANRNRWRRCMAPCTVALFVASLVAACSGDDSGTIYPDDDYRRQGESSYDKPEGGLFGEGGISLGSSVTEPEGGAGPGIGVNSFLWRASLDTISFMPLASADPFGGVIITDWYTPPDTAGERFKINLYILGRELRADGVQAAVFRQVRQDGTWIDAEVDEQTAVDLENAILTRARQMRIAGLE